MPSMDEDEERTRVPVSGCKFILFDLDGTILETRTRVSSRRNILPVIIMALERLKAQGHHLAVCSNNVMAKALLHEFNILNLFDFVIGKPSGTFKVLEVMECWRFYRYLYHTRVIRAKIQLHKVLFVDDDPENRAEIAKHYTTVAIFSSVREVMETIPTLSPRLTRSIPIKNVWNSICASAPVQRVPMSIISRSETSNIICISSLARLPNKAGSRNMKYHLQASCDAARRCIRFHEVCDKVALKSGHALCMLCEYNAQWPVTNTAGTRKSNHGHADDMLNG